MQALTEEQIDQRVEEIFSRKRPERVYECCRQKENLLSLRFGNQVIEKCRCGRKHHLIVATGV